MQDQAFFSIEPIHEFLLHRPALAFEQHRHFPVPVLDPRLTQLPQLLPQGHPRISVTPILMSRSVEFKGLAGLPFAD